MMVYANQVMESTINVNVKKGLKDLIVKKSCIHMLIHALVSLASMEANAINQM